MDLYHKKINIDNKQRRRGRERNIRENNQNKNIYLQKMIQQTPPGNDSVDMSSAGDNIHNIRTNMEDIFSKEETKKKAIRYVIEAGKAKYLRNSPKTADRHQKSVSPINQRVGGQNSSGNLESFKATPNRTYYDSRSNNIPNSRINPPPENNNYGYTLNTVSNFYNPNQRNINNYGRIYNNPNRSQKQIPNQNYIEGEEEYYESPPNYNNLNPEESQNEYEISSSNNLDERNYQVIPGMKFSKSPEPKLVNRIPQVLIERYQKASRQQNYPISMRRNKDIQIMPQQKNPINNNYNNVDQGLEDEIDELVRTMDDMQSIINGQKNQIKNNIKDINRKNKEINFLKNELNNLQKELDDKMMEHDQEMDNIFSNNNNTKLKNEYYKLLQDFENIIIIYIIFVILQ